MTLHTNILDNIIQQNWKLYLWRNAVCFLWIFHFHNKDTALISKLFDWKFMACTKHHYNENPLFLDYFKIVHLHIHNISYARLITWQKQFGTDAQTLGCIVHFGSSFIFISIWILKHWHFSHSFFLLKIYHLWKKLIHMTLVHSMVSLQFTCTYIISDNQDKYSGSRSV